MKPRSSWSRGVLAGLVAASSACAAPEAAELAALRAVLDSVRIEAEAPGAILGVQVGEAPPRIVAVGHADLAAGQPMVADQPYFLGSVSKTYTAAIVLSLVEEGVLDLDDPLERWLPGFPRADEISLRHLLGHTSGLKDFYSYIYFRPDREEMERLVTKEWTETELIELSGRFGHWFDPGAEWSYSSTNYYLLGVVVERASGSTLAEAHRTHLYRPLSLSRTWLSWHEEPRGDLLPGFMGPVEGWEHSEMFGELGATTHLDRSPVEWGAGGLAAPAGDALRFIGGLMRGEVLSPETLPLMFDFVETPPLGVDAGSVAVADDASGYGLGLVRMVREGRTLIGHGGLFTGHTAGLWYSPECDAAVAVYFNRGFVGQRMLLDRVLAMLGDGTLGEGC